MNKKFESRKLNPLERVCTNLNYRNGAFNCQIEGEFTGKLPNTILYQAVKIVQSKHSFLNVSIIGETNPEYIYNPNSEIQITHLYDEDWLLAAELELNKTFDYKSSSLCTIIHVENIDSFHVILTLDHTIVDGISGALLFEDLIFICDQLISGENHFSVESIPEVIIDSNSFPLNLNHELKFFAPARAPLEGQYTAPFEQRYTHFLPMLLSNDCTQKLVDQCKEHQVSVHAGVSAILLMTLAKEIRIKSKSSIEPILDLVAPVSLRKLFLSPIADNQLGLAVLQMKTQHHIYENSDKWIVAKDIYQKIKGIIDNGEIFLAHKDLLMQQDLPSEKTHQDRERKVPYLIFSNLGRIDFGKRLRNIIPNWVNFSAQMKNGQGMEWGLFFTGITASFNNQFALNLHYLHPYWDKKRAEEFKRELFLNFENL